MGLRLSGTALLLLGSLSCSPLYYKEDADKQVAGILENKQLTLFGEASPISIEQQRDMLRTEMLIELDRLRKEQHEALVRELTGQPPEPGVVEPEQIDPDPSTEFFEEEDDNPLNPVPRHDPVKSAGDEESGDESKESGDESKNESGDESAGDPSSVLGTGTLLHPGSPDQSVRSKLVVEYADAFLPPFQGAHRVSAPQLAASLLGSRHALQDSGNQDRPGGEPLVPDKGENDLQATLLKVERTHQAELTPGVATAPPLLPRRVLSLVECLRIAAGNNRTYQREKELVYLTALDLTFERYQFQNQYGVTSNYQWTSNEIGTYLDQNGILKSKRQRAGALTTSLSMTRLLASGGFLVIDFTNSFLKRFTGVQFLGNRSTNTSSDLSVSFTQPLLRGAGWQVVQEPLIQSERDVFYALRSFERFRREFAVGVATEYYNLVQQVDAVANARSSYIQFINSRLQTQELAARGRQSQIQVDQARSSELAGRNSWLRSIQQYEDGLDRFKITLGLPMEANLSLDPEELATLVAEGPIPAEWAEGEATTVALSLRLDFLNTLNQLQDAERQVNVAADALKAGLDLNASYAVSTDRDTVFDLMPSDADWGLGIRLDLPVDRLRERNAFRASLINLNVQRRATSLAEDQIKQFLRDVLRNLEQLGETYKIAINSVEVAERRVDSTFLFLRQGRIEIRDALDATDSLTASRNALTAALVDYRVALLDLYLELGLLRVSDEGIAFATPEVRER